MCVFTEQIKALNWLKWKEVCFETRQLYFVYLTFSEICTAILSIEVLCIH